MKDETVVLSPLGKKTTYISEYQRDLLYAIPRQLNRDEIHVPSQLPFKGVDLWTAYELSWLNSHGKPVVAMAEFIFPCESPAIIESKSFKLYLNSYTNSRFAKEADVEQLLQQDLSEYAGASVHVKITSLKSWVGTQLESFSGICLDNLDITCDTYSVEPRFLQTESAIVTETVYSDLVKSNCLVTGQPDWASVQIHYVGAKINHEGLLRYLISLRNHNEFHEQCVERIFMDILRQCQPRQLTVYARYTRRGGLDINPFRSTEKGLPDNLGRQVRQ